MSFRLPRGGRIDRGQTLRFRYNGREYHGLQGDTLASALLANGVVRVARSWKYHRPRGLLSAGVEEPNALVQLFEGARTVPNAKATETELIDGLVARSVNASPSVEWDLRAVHGWFSRLMPAGFYYKTFMASQRAWHFFEHHIRKASGLGESPRLPDPDHYARRFAHCDVLVVGGGVAGLCAALSAGAAGARVILCDEQAEPGGWLLCSDELIDGVPSDAWVSQALLRLREMPEVIVLPRTTAFGFHDHSFVTLAERLGDHRPESAQQPCRERLWKVRARQVVLATGAHERPLVFAHNDLPGVMLASAVSTYLRRYAVAPGQRAVLFTNNSLAYDAALALHSVGLPVLVIDARDTADGDAAERARSAGIPITTGHVVTQALGRSRVRGVRMQRIDAQGQLIGTARTLACDLLAVSGGFSPVIHLHGQAGSRPVWNEALAAFLPGPAMQGELSAGGCTGARTLREAAHEGCTAGTTAAARVGFEATPSAPPLIPSIEAGQQRTLWLVPHPAGASRAPKQFVDLQNDVAASDLLLAVREGFESIEHVKRFTAMGFGTDQGKTGNINGMGIIAQALGRPIPEVGTTTFRPNYTPISFGLLAGPELGEGFDPVRTTPMHDWHLQQGAKFEDVGQWKRPWYYPRQGEDLHAAVRREVRAVREQVGMLDASTLGKIDIQGPDAVTLLNWMYSNGWTTLEVGKCRYGLMLDENGMVFDDGVTVRLGEHHYLMHTTTGGAARVLAWMERWLQTEWPHLKVYLTTVTDHWATTVLAGPNSRDVLRQVCADVDFDDAAFPFMAWREGSVAGVPARLMRISFSGERAYEINVAAANGERVWKAIHAAGTAWGITPYGTEAMHVLRSEKGFIIVGQDTDGSVTPIDLGLSGMIAKGKDFLGKRSLTRDDTARPDRKQWVGLLTDDGNLVLPEGAQVLAGPPGNLPMPMHGHVTSSYDSPTLGRSIAQALIQGGHQRMGQRVHIGLRDGGSTTAVICSPVFFDPEGARQHV